MDRFEAECLCGATVQVIPSKGSGRDAEFVYTPHTFPGGIPCMYVNARVPRTRNVLRLGVIGIARAAVPA